MSSEDKFQTGGIVDQVDVFPLTPMGYIVPLDWRERLAKLEIDVKITLEVDRIEEALFVKQTRAFLRLD